MLHDFRHEPDGLSFDCDICVAGAGAAGLTIAQRFLDTEARVIVLESGGVDFDETIQDLAAGDTVGQPYFDLDGCRLRMFGGSTNHWAGECAPLDQIDFEPRPWVPHSGWPISYQSMAAWYDQARALLRLGSFHDDADLDDRPPYLAFDPSLITHKIWRHSEPPLRFGEAFGARLDVSSNIRVLTHANLVQILTNPTRQVVQSFEIAALDGKTASIRAAYFILALGGLENPRLLLNTGQGSMPALGNERDLVGRFFMDHLNIIGGEVIASDGRWPQAYRQTHQADSPRTVYVRCAPALQQTDRLLNSAVSFRQTTVTRRRSLGYASLHSIKSDLQHHQMPDRLGYHLWNVLSDMTGVVAGVTEKMTPSVWLDLEAEQAPNPESRVVLNDARDRLNLRRITLDWQLTELDRRSVAALVETVGREIGRLHAGRLRLASPMLSEEGGWSGDEVEGGYHHMGTTRMADDPSRGVVDAQCRLFGTDNLYMAGSSVFPTSGCANPTLTIVALALRLAAHVKARL